MPLKTDLLRLLAAYRKYRRWININKHKFLAELGRLLTFMYEEDRETTLSMYERMFDECADEQALVQLLVSPTRQAVVLARSYDAKERKLQIESRSMDENYMPDPEDVPSFVFVIDKTAQQAAELGVKTPAVAEGQVSIFEAFEDMAPPAELAPVSAEEQPEAPAAAAEAEAAPAANATAALPETAAPAPAEPAPQDDAAEAESVQERSSVDETADAVDAFLADFTIENGELVSSKAAAEEQAQPEDAAAPAAAEAAEEETPAAPVEQPETPAAATRIRTNILLLVFYIFLAIPIGLVGIALLLIPTALLLALAISCASVGVSIIGMCFTSFAVIADTMVVFGAALAALALALLFVWMFIWFLGGVIVSFIRGICSLGRKLCCKEVAVQ